MFYTQSAELYSDTPRQIYLPDVLRPVNRKGSYQGEAKSIIATTSKIMIHRLLYILLTCL